MTQTSEEKLPNIIHQLSDLVINQIAAGEVVDRPASIVRELVDNSIDAGASEIVIDLEDGGRELIRVSDNGCGMTKEDAQLAWLRHATSKIESERELEAISTFGFRGEALAAVASVSKVRMRTFSREVKVGTEVRLIGGEVNSVTRIVRQPGTEIEVRSLFFNTPARRKFLRKGQTEAARVKQWLNQYVLAHPKLKFILNHESKTVITYLPTRSCIERMTQVYTGDYFNFSREIRGMQVEGRLSHPGMASTRNANLAIFVNNRLVRDKLLVKAIKEGYDHMLKAAEVPSGSLRLNLPFYEVDVNVHPQKSEVRFRNPQEVFVAVRAVVKSALIGLSDPSIPKPAQGSGSWAGKSYSYNGPTSSSQPSFAVSENPPVERALPFWNLNRESALAENRVVDLPNISESHEGFKYSKLRYVGQILECYLICELEQGLYVLDMHAAHERVTFNRLRRGCLDGGVASQQLLTPVSIKLSGEQFDNIDNAKELLVKFGFAIEEFGEDTIIVRASPTQVSIDKIEELILALSDLELTESVAYQLEDVLDKIAIRIACHSSIRSGYLIKREEVYALLKALDETETAGACPHGRPVIVRFKLQQIEQWFGRDR